MNKTLVLQLALGLFLNAGMLQAAEPVKVILDTDMANDCDDAGALAVLNALVDRGEAEMLAVVTNRHCPSEASAAAVDAINTWYGHGDTPIGTDKDESKTPDPSPSSYTPALRDGFPHDTPPDSECSDALMVYRKRLAAQPDKSVVICSVGALSNLEDLYNSEADEHSPLSGPELIAAKVRLTVIMGGGFPKTERPETNIKLDPAAAVTVANLWPGEILWQGYEVGKAIITGDCLQHAPRYNPVRRAFQLRPFGKGFAIDHGKPSHDQAAVLLAVRGPQPELWEVRRDGRAIFDSDGHSRWSTDWRKKHAYVIIKGTPDKLTQQIEELMMQKSRIHSPE
ncbi:nucleoside hydrolase [Rubinisphaera margarita]|uniref:nucleoside hydrolase n=1 Tax=Rubinisphaera margarita TaxID=2909586 RepID=UPI001EE89B23|nr:nucleoside hydrolase [Rubinisphaera margarita]MCG6155185.1 nucleoside hydrolase [Rubinisphaera margarita]